MDNLQSQVNARVEAFVAEITELARASAYQTLSSALDGGQLASGRGAAPILRGRRGGKRTADEITQMADAFLAHVTTNPGQRMEHIAREFGLGTPELTLPVKKLLADGKLRVEGQKRVSPIGFTDLYNRFHDADDVDPRIVRLREMHREIDAAVMRAYGWADLDLGHGYHEQPNLAESDRVRFTISDAARAEVLRRFAELNRQRYEEEQASAPAPKPRSKGRAKAASAGLGAFALVDEPAAEPKTCETKDAAPAKKASKRRPQ